MHHFWSTNTIVLTPRLPDLGALINPALKLFVPAIAALAVSGSACSAQPYVIRVGSSSEATGGTSADKIVTTIGAALTEMHAKQKTGWTHGFEIELAPGVYHLESTLALQSSDSGTPEAPLVIRAQSGGQAIFSGSKEYFAKPFSGQKLGKADQKLPPDSKSLFVVEIDEAIESFVKAERPRGSVYSPTPAGLQLFQGGSRLTPARWPKTGYSVASGVVFTGDEKKGPIFHVPPDKVQDWSHEPALWAGGFWGHDWHWETTKIVGSDSAHGTLETAPLRARYKTRPDARYFVYNSLADLTDPGEYYVDIDNRLIALRPLQTGADQASVEVSVLETIAELANVHDVVFEGVTFEKARGDLVKVDKSNNVRFKNCRFLQAGSRGIVVKEGHDVAIENSIIAHTGESGADLSGGDRASLTPSRHSISHTIITDGGRDVKSYRPLVALNGVGQVVDSSLLFDTPHTAILYGGNDHVISRNEIAHVVTETRDAGAIYAGRDWTARGTRIVGNYFHDIKAFAGKRDYDAHCIYLDDFISGTILEDNIFENIDQGIFINSGRDNFVRGNIFAGFRQAAVRIQDLTGGPGVDQIAQGVGLVVDRLKEMPYQSPAWRYKYQNIPQIWSDNPTAPKYTVVSGNTFIGQHGLQFDRGAEVYVSAENNLSVSLDQPDQIRDVWSSAGRKLGLVDADEINTLKAVRRTNLCSSLLKDGANVTCTDMSQP
jgi:parallel beta-helix repeat protein